MMLFGEGEPSLAEAAERAVENADVKTLMGLLKKNPNTPIASLLSKAIKLLESIPDSFFERVRIPDDEIYIGWQNLRIDWRKAHDVRLCVIEELIQHSFVATDDLLKTAVEQQTVLEKRCCQIVIPPMSESDSSVERACRRQMLIDQLMGDAPTLPPRPDDLRPARIAKIVGIIRSNLEAQNRHVNGGVKPR